MALVVCLDTDGLCLYARDAEVHKILCNDASDGNLIELFAREQAEETETACVTCGCGRGQGLHSSPCDRSPNSLHNRAPPLLSPHLTPQFRYLRPWRGNQHLAEAHTARKLSLCALHTIRRQAPPNQRQHGRMQQHPANARPQANGTVQLGRLTHYAFDAVLVSAFLAGVKRSTGLTYVSNPPSSPSPSTIA